MKLSEYARKMGIHYKTAWRWWKTGKLPGFQQDTGTVIVSPEPSALSRTVRVAIYARVSGAVNRPNLDSQAERLEAYCAAKGYQIQQVIKEVGSGGNDHRPKFLKSLADATITTIVVEHNDRATRFGFQYLETLLTQQGRTREVVNLAVNGRED